MQISPTAVRVPAKRPASTSIKQPPTKRQDTTTTSKSPPTVEAIILSPLPAVSKPQSPVKVQVPRPKPTGQQAKPLRTAQASQPKILNTQAQVKVLNKEAPSNTVQIRQVITDESGDTFELTEVVKEQSDLLEAEHVATNVYPCTKCERSFPLRQLLSIHMVNHARERCFECDICSKRFFSKYDLGKHTLIHTGDKPFVCVICKKAFSRSTLLSRHERIHTDQPKYLCAHCDRPFLSKIELDKHSIRHDKKRPFPCNVCNKTFAFKQGLERHEVIHSKVQPYKCEHCEVSFSTPSKLARHLTAHAGRRPYPCRLCPKSYLLSHHLTRHVRSHKDATGTFKCFNCSKVFKNRSELVYHSAIHATQDLVCPLCKEGFGSINDVTAHIKSHTEGEQYACEFCDLIFTTDERLCDHTAKEHADEYATYAHDERTRVIKREVGAVLDSPHLNDGVEIIEEYIIETISETVSPPPPRILNYTVKPTKSVIDQNDDEEEEDEENESIPIDEVEIDEAEIEYEEEEFEDDASRHDDEGMEFEVENVKVKEEKDETPITATPPLVNVSPKIKNEKLASPPAKQIPIAQQKLEQSLQAALRTSVRSVLAAEPKKSLPIVKTLPVKSPPVKSPPVKSPPVKESLVQKEPSPVLRKVNVKSLPSGISVKRKVSDSVVAPKPVILPPKLSPPPPKATVREQAEPKPQTTAPVTRAKTGTSGSNKPPASSSTKKSPPTSHEKPSSSGNGKSSSDNGKTSGPTKPSASSNNTTKSPASNSDKPSPSSSSRPSTRNASKDVVNMMIGNEMVQVQKVKMTKAQMAEMALEGKIEMKDGQMFLKHTKNDKK